MEEGASIHQTHLFVCKHVFKMVVWHEPYGCLQGIAYMKDQKRIQLMTIEHNLIFSVWPTIHQRCASRVETRKALSPNGVPDHVNWGFSLFHSIISAIVLQEDTIPTFPPNCDRVLANSAGYVTNLKFSMSRGKFGRNKSRQQNIRFNGSCCCASHQRVYWILLF